MKKIFAILLAVTMFASMAIVASAAENTTTLTTTVPAATYTLNIPANQEIEFNAQATNIGSISVTAGTGFAAGKNLKVTTTYSAFTSENVETTIPFSVRIINSTYDNNTFNPDAYKNIASGEGIVFLGHADGTIDQYCYISYNSPNGSLGHWLDQTVVMINAADWGKALAGDYTATITFTAEVVVEQ